MRDPRIQIYILILIWITAMRLLALRGMLRMPRKNGEGWFLSTEVEPGFYKGRGIQLLRRYRTAILMVQLVDWLVLAAFVVSGHLSHAVLEQVVSTILLTVGYNLVMLNFAYVARATAQPGTVAPSTASEVTRQISSVQLSLEPRRLRDYTNWTLESLIFLALATGLVLPLARGRQLSPPAAFVWLLYLHVGLLLLKLLFVHWRMKFPVARTDDYKRWRAAWLRYHLRLFDGLRVLLTSVLLNLSVLQVLDLPEHSRLWRLASVALWIPVLIGAVVFWVLESRRLAAAHKEIKPFELTREYPPPQAAEGRFLAGGLLYFNREDPLMLAASREGIAVNIAHRGTYIWVGYIIGLVGLFVWQIAA
jgi:hypothetical protein